MNEANKSNAKNITLTELLRLFGDDPDAKALIESCSSVEEVWDKCQDGGLMIRILKQWDLLDPNEGGAIVDTWQEEVASLPKTIGRYCREAWNSYVIGAPKIKMHVVDIVYESYRHHIQTVAEVHVCVNYLMYVLTNEQPISPGATRVEVETFAVTDAMKLDECLESALKAEAAHQADLIRSIVKVQFAGANGSTSSGAKDTVRIYDLKTKSVCEIPAAELAPGYVRIHQEGIGIVYAKIDELDSSAPIRHPPFSRELRKIFWRLQKVLDEVYPQTIDGWEDGFRRDTNPGPQILSWVRAAQIYEKCLRTLRPVGLESRKGCFQVIKSCAINGPEHALHVLNVPAESRAVALQIVEICKARPDERETSELKKVAATLDNYFGSQGSQGESEP